MTSTATWTVRAPGQAQEALQNRRGALGSVIRRYKQRQLGGGSQLWQGSGGRTWSPIGSNPLSGERLGGGWQNER